MRKIVLVALVIYFAFGASAGIYDLSHQATIDDGPGPMSVKKV